MRTWQLLIAVAVFAAVAVFVLACTFLTTPAEARADRGIQNYVYISVYDMYGDYCHTIEYSYLTPDTTTQHYRFYHRGPTVPDTHDDDHLTVIVDSVSWFGEWDLDTLCSGSQPVYA